MNLLPRGSEKPALEFPHFPNRQACFLFRNHALVPEGKLAAILGTTPEKIRESVRMMGLLPCRAVDPELFRVRGYITLVRQNWHLLNYDQLLELLEISGEELAFRLKEDDFLFGKLGALKPSAEPIHWRDWTPRETERLLEIGEILRRHPVGMEDFHPFAFGPRASIPLKPTDRLRMSYPYSAGCGDFLSDDSLEAFPEKMFADYAGGGINAIWIQLTLYKLVPWTRAPGMAAGFEKRLRNLKRIAERGGKYGVKLYPYFNEPRTVPKEYADSFRDLGRRTMPDHSLSLCTSHGEVRKYLADAVETVFRVVPELGGMLTITRSENFTNCASSVADILKQCPVCSKNGAEQTIADVLNAYADGLVRANPKARLLAYAWNWEESWLEGIAARMKHPENTSFLTVSECGVKTDCEGWESEVIDYSIAHPGPGAFAKKVWAAARGHGLGGIAKIQLNNSWELSAVPYLPVFDLIEKHITDIRKEGIDDFMLCWTHGGGPSPLTALFEFSLPETMRKLYGPNAEIVNRAQKEFSSAFAQFPFDYAKVIYFAPVNRGPVNLLWEKPTGYKATMVGIPYDDLESWRGRYPRDVFSRAFDRISKGWKQGLNLLESSAVSPGDPNTEELLRYAKTAYCHLRSTRNQIEFTRLRDAGFPSGIPKELLNEEIRLAEENAKLQIADPSVGFEASNSYFYTPNLLLEKILNCETLLRSL